MPAPGIVTSALGRGAGQNLSPGQGVTILLWKHRVAHYDQNFNEILVGAPQFPPLSHKLLLAHEVADMTRPTAEQYGSEWCGGYSA